jgi:hypothetical protein
MRLILSLTFAVFLDFNCLIRLAVALVDNLVVDYVHGSDVFRPALDLKNPLLLLERADFFADIMLVISRALNQDHLAPAVPRLATAFVHHGGRRATVGHRHRAWPRLYNLWGF